MSQIRVVPLGAGQDVGRSCILVCIGQRTIMFDCGMHMGFDDKRRFPNFDFISAGDDLTNHLDCVIISHFHLDHCGALPYFSEIRGYNGPIYMTVRLQYIHASETNPVLTKGLVFGIDQYPTKAICPILLEDYRKVTVERFGNTDFFTSDHIRSCMSKVIAMNVHETIRVDEHLEITPYYAGHVLGAAMFHVRVGDQSVLYTGDYNMTPDRHLGAARVPRLMPDVLISESTYATTIRDSKRLRERDLLKQIHTCIEGGGKVLIPVFALGRAQELFILVETYWERMNLSVPVYFTTGLAARANDYYRLFISWTNQKIKQTFVRQNMFEFSHIKPYERGFASRKGAMVVFATPGMLHAGQSLELFKQWCGDSKNSVILPGYCVAGTVGNKILAGQKRVRVDRTTTLDVKCGVSKVSFSAHADSKGILQLIRQTLPRQVVLVHGEAQKMKVLKEKIEQDFGTNCHFPANGTTITVDAASRIPVDIASIVLQELEISSPENGEPHKRFEEGLSDKRLTLDVQQGQADAAIRKRVVRGVLVAHPEKNIRLLRSEDAVSELSVPRHRLRFSMGQKLPESLKNVDPERILHSITRHLSPANEIFEESSNSFRARSVLVCIETSQVKVSWEYDDEATAAHIRSKIGVALADLSCSRM